MKMEHKATRRRRTLVVDDHDLFRSGLVSLLNDQPDFKVVGEARTLDESVNKCIELEPDLILMDFILPDGDGLEATQTILSVCPETRIVFLTIYETDELLFSAIRSGAKGYLVKNISVKKMLGLLRGLDEGEAAITLKMASRILEEFARREWRDHQGDPAFDDLTVRELDILRIIASGATNREIAAQLFLSENTVKNHVHSILEKLKLHNRREAAYLAARYQKQLSL
jgi:two-component system NarL family response regulator